MNPSYIGSFLYLILFVSTCILFLTIFSLRFIQCFVCPHMLYSFTLCHYLFSVPPSIDEANIVDNPRVIVNRTVLLECPVAGVPPPKVEWLKNGESLQLDPGMVLISDGRQLEIARAQVVHTARFTCIASNEAGELQRNFDLEVYGKLKINFNAIFFAGFTSVNSIT